MSETPTRRWAETGLESATTNLLVGPFAAMIDRARDALSSKSQPAPATAARS